MLVLSWVMIRRVLWGFLLLFDFKKFYHFLVLVLNNVCLGLSVAALFSVPFVNYGFLGVFVLLLVLFSMFVFMAVNLQIFRKVSFV